MEDPSLSLARDGSGLGTNDLSSGTKPIAAPTSLESHTQFHFQLTADFYVALDYNKEFLTPLDKDALRSISRSPIAMSTMAWIAMQFQMAHSNSCSLNDHFPEPTENAIIACLKGCLSNNQWREWQALKGLPMDPFSESLMRIVFAFVVTLRSASYAPVIPAQ